MSIALHNSKPEGLVARSPGIGSPSIIYIGDYEIPMNDFADLVCHVFTNTDIVRDDPRLELKRKIASLELKEGFNEGSKRFGP